MNLNYDLAKAEMANRLRRARTDRAVELVRTRHHSVTTRRWRSGRW
jgi:hypothetical protein